MNYQLLKRRLRSNVQFIAPAILLLLVAVCVIATQGSVKQKNDITQVAAFLQEAYDENTGAISVSPGQKPNELNICTAHCSHINFTAKLGYYNNQDISMHDYAPGLAVPSAKVVYIVDNADCNSDFNGLGAYGVASNGNPAQSVLYANTSNKKLVQHCENVFGPNPSGQ